jgi:hypothetical protein
MSNPAADPIGATYVKLALALEEHVPGYIDGYYGPPAWQAEAKAAGQRPLPELARAVDELAQAIQRDGSLVASRRDYLGCQVRAMQTSLRLLQGEKLSLVEETEGLYDITPGWVDEARFEEAHRTLDELLPPGNSLPERMVARRKALEVSVERAEPLLAPILAELQRRTQARWELPPGEAFELQLVKDQSWSAYNWYLGNFRSRIDVNTDLPLHITALTDLMAHEGYPGHHTEHALKEARLLQGQGHIEHCVLLINAPECVVSEGIATRALKLVMSDEELIGWHQEELFPRAGLGQLDARREHTIGQATKHLEGVSGNAALLLHDRGASQAEVVAYVQRYGLRNEREAQQTYRFVSNPLYRSYTFTYRYGGELLDALFAARAEREQWYGRLLSEAATPSGIRAWTEQA